ncbi:SMP-30/gluconolactonase/LRE family protein [Aurantimonas sp. A2-1-M11]|uniref:SMP-30/gluconolactonase/LRE family protein n=1 Tax=Aurantimonas sp. A2-1-M11 TaxID=3113712 RepID=UPI002F92F4B2
MLSLSGITFHGHGLNRPECVLTHQSGLLLTADWTDGGGVAIIEPSGRVSRHLARNPPRPLRPNGIALERGGSILLTELGAETGGVWRLHPDGMTEPVLLEVEGAPLPPANFVHLDAAGRMWVTVSTRMMPRHLAARGDVADGFIVLVEDGRARIVADGIGFSNECLVSPDGRHLYVNETFARRLTRFTIRDGGLHGQHVVTSFGPGTYPDGMTFDCEGHLWITSIVSNRVIRVSPDGEQTLVLEDADPDHVAHVEEAYATNSIERSHLDTMKSRKLRAISSLAFGGPDLRVAYLGCLQGESIASFECPIAGAAPVHWALPIDALQRRIADLPALAPTPS